MEISKEETRNIAIIRLLKPKTVLQQYKIAVERNCEWILITDNDAELIHFPNYFVDYEYDFISFYWIDAPKIFNRNHFGIGLYRTSVLKKILKYNYLTSEGLDLALAYQMKTNYSTLYTYKHNSKLTMKRLFRYGKGRAFFIKQCKPKENKFPTIGKFYLSYLHLYFAYGCGFLYGTITKPKDRNW